MAWFKKEQLTQFDDLEIFGLHFLIGDMLAWLSGYKALQGQKYPEVEFPSGESFAIWEGGDSPIIHIFGEMDLALLNSTRDEAFDHATDVAEYCGYLARKVRDNQLEVMGRDDDEYYRLTYDNEQRQLIDIEAVKDEPKPQVIHPAHQLMTDEIREKLPPLYANENVGLMAMAIVKYFTPTSNYTWYASEFDGEDIFFGLVAGDFVELGYFSLSELQSIGGGLTLPIERDLHFEPKTLKELKAWHENNQ